MVPGKRGGIGALHCCGISGLPLLASLGSLGNRKTLPYVCALVAILYGLILGLVRLPLFDVMRALLNWLVPVRLRPLHLSEPRASIWNSERAIERSFLFGTLLTGAYGIYQFFTLPDWDRMWMLNVQLNSFGAVEAMKVRVFSTMNAPAIYAAITVCGLLLLFNMQGQVAPAFSGMRVPWADADGEPGFLVEFGSGRNLFDDAFRDASTCAPRCCGLCLRGFPGGPHPGSGRSRFAPAADAILLRPQSGRKLLRARGWTRAGIHQIAQEPFGEGVGSTDAKHNTEGDDDIIGPHDSTILEFLYSLGWIGTLVYAMGLGSLAFQVIKVGRRDPFVDSAKAILVGFAAQCLLNSVMIGVLGFMVWTFASMSLAAADFRSAAEDSEVREKTSEARYAAA